MLPSKSWEAYEEVVRAVGEQRFRGAQDDLRFLDELGLIEGRNGPALTPEGRRYFNAQFIQGAAEDARNVLHESLLA